MQRGVQKMRFWRLNHPEYDSDYRHIFINGSLEHPFGLPGVVCDRCGQTWGGSRVLSYDCPELLRTEEKLTNRWPIQRADHEALQRDLMRKLSISGEPFHALRPGDELQPCLFSAPSTPRADFLWPSLASFLVSDRIARVFRTACGEDVRLCPVTLRKIGKRNAKLPPPIPSSGEPEDMIDEVSTFQDTTEIGPYFELLVQTQSGTPPLERISVCEGCKREEIDRQAPEIRMTDEMWRGHSIFFLATTLFVVVTDEIRQVIVESRATNVAFSEI